MAGASYKRSVTDLKLFTMGQPAKSCWDKEGAAVGFGVLLAPGLCPTRKGTEHKRRKADTKSTKRTSYSALFVLFVFRSRFVGQSSQLCPTSRLRTVGRRLQPVA